MTIQDTNGIVPYGMFHDANQLIASNQITHDAVNDRTATVFQIPKDGTLNSISFYTRDVTTGEVVDVRLETVDLTTGEPTGTLKETGSNGSVTIADSDDQTKKTSAVFNSGSGVAVLMGKLVAVVVASPASSGGDWDRATANQWWEGGFPYRTVNLTGSWVFGGAPPVVILNYDTGVEYGVGITAFKSISSSVSINSGATVAEAGVKFQFPHAARIAGFMFNGSILGPMRAHLYNASGKPQDTGATRLATLATGVIDNNVTKDSTLQWFQYLFSSSVEIAANTTFYMSLEATTAVNNSLQTATVEETADMPTIIGGATWILVADDGAGDWDETDTRHPWIIPLIDGLDDGAGGGGGGTLPVGRKGLAG